MTPETKVLFFDTETSDFIKKALPANDPEQAWTVQIGAILASQQEEFDQMNVIIKSNGRSMNYYAQEVHGITVERADTEGIEELEAAERFGKMLREAELVVCHNFSFDWNYVYQMMERNLDDLSDEARSAFYLDLPNHCTMKDKAVVKMCGLKNKAGRPKWPKLTELHEHLFGECFDGAHDAYADISATKRCFFELVNRGIVVPNLEG
jgi:DNA polymerase III epsilon subunit-like protein